jgi:hypothetical protein
MSRRGEAEPVLVHGGSVFVGDGFACDGGWNGAADRSGLLSATARFGNALTWDSSGAVEIWTAIFPVSRVWTVESGDSLLVSNSLPLALALGGVRLEPAFPHYEADLLHFVERPERRSWPVHTVGEGRVRQHGHSVITVEAGRLVATRADHSQEAVPPFDSYAQYRAQLAATTSSLFENLGDARRPRRYAPLVTLSSGYDSTACAVLAREAGAVEGMSFPVARPGLGDDDDDGTEIGETIGLEVTRRDRFAYQAEDGRAERWALADGSGGEDVTFASYGDLSGRLLLTGYGGDAVWRRTIEPHVARGRMAGADGVLGMNELRIQMDFVHVPLPVVDLFRQRRMVALSNSAEMEPWMVGGYYDRPIPRRIGEEAGVPRNAFGVAKKVTSVPFYQEDEVGQAFGASAAAALREWIESLEPPPAAEAYNRTRASKLRWRGLLHRVSDAATRHPIPAWLGDALRPRYTDRWRRPWSPDLLATNWAIEVTREVYVEALRGTAVV